MSSRESLISMNIELSKLVCMWYFTIIVPASFIGFLGGLIFSNMIIVDLITIIIDILISFGLVSIFAIIFGSIYLKYDNLRRNKK